jgi:TonB family protein
LRAGFAHEGPRSWSPAALLIATVASVGMFAVVIAPAGRPDDASSEKSVSGRRVIYLLPLQPGRMPQPRAEEVHWSTLTPRTGVGPIGTGTPRHGGGGPATVAVQTPTPAPAADPGDGGRVYIESEMGRPVRRDASSAAPTYPEFLQHEGIEGVVAVEYIVDTTGLADSASLRILHASNPAFAESVRAALPGMRFVPGEVGGQLVRQLVTQEFRFVISGSAPPPPPATPPRHRGH